MSRPIRALRGTLALLLLLASQVPVARADGVPPVTLQIREQESGRFVANWRVPQALPPRAIPSPILPDSCRAVGERSLTERPGAWFLRQVYACPEGLSGQLVGIDFPMLNATVSTILRIELLSGDRYAHSFAPAEGAWKVPDATAGDARARYRGARQAVLAGADHFVRHGLHWTFLAALLLLGGATRAARLAAVFAAGQLAGVAISAITGLQAPAMVAQVGLAAAVALLAAEALKPADERRQLAVLAAAAGLAHGLGLAGFIATPAGYDGPSWVFFALTIVGMDALLLLAAATAALLQRIVARPVPEPARTTIAYLAGAGAVALVLGFPASRLEAEAGPTTPALQLPDLPIPEGGAASPASRRVAAQFPDAPIQSFITVAPFEVRHEVLVRLRDLLPELDIEVGADGSGTVELNQLDAVKQRLLTILAGRHGLTIDEQTAEPELARTDFLTVDDRGVLPRPDPVSEDVETAWIGLTTAYLTPKTPTTLSLTWSGLGAEDLLPATITDPETTRSEELTARRPTLLWSNELAEDPTPVISAFAVEPPVAWVPVLSILVAGLAIALGLIVWRKHWSAFAGPLARVAVAAACVLAPLGAVAVPLPSSFRAAPDAQDAQRVLARLLPNIYRAFEFPTESAVYDRLALAATGDTLGEIYLEHRRAVELEERGGARARVEAVEVLGVDSVEPASTDGFVADAVWTVGGTVTHFGHRHYRRNRYDARVTVVPTDGTWKIRTIEVFDEERLQ